MLSEYAKVYIYFYLLLYVNFVKCSLNSISEICKFKNSG